MGIKIPPKLALNFRFQGQFLSVSPKKQWVPPISPPDLHHYLLHCQLTVLEAIFRVSHFLGPVWCSKNCFHYCMPVISN